VTRLAAGLGAIVPGDLGLSKRPNGKYLSQLVPPDKASIMSRPMIERTSYGRPGALGFGV